MLSQTGISDDELSFLLGKPNNYVFGFVMNPGDKNRFTEDQIDLLPYILKCKFTDIIPSTVESGSISLCNTENISNEEYKGFRHTIYENGEYRQIIWRKRKAEEGSYRKNNPQLLSVIRSWINEGYFDTMRDGLEINNRLADLAFKTSVSDLEKCLKSLVSKNTALLRREMIDGIYKYHSPILKS